MLSSLQGGPCAYYANRPQTGAEKRPGVRQSCRHTGIQENQKLNAYVKKLRAALKEAGIPYAHDKFVPHITLIRRSVSKKPYQVHLQKAEMNVDKISLMKSERKNGKMVYQEI